MATRIAILLLATLLAAFPAKAATTTFATSVFSSVNVTDPANALGFTNGSGAVIGGGGELVLEFNNPLTGEGFAATLLDTGVVGAVNVIAVSLGEVVGGTPIFSGEFVLADMGSGGVLGGDFSGLCSGVSVSGCSLVKFRNVVSLNGSPGAILDSVSGVTNAPEPGTWALMMLGFAGLGWRMKQVKAKKGEGWAVPLRPSLFRPAF